jgi:hypothetical protein
MKSYTDLETTLVHIFNREIGNEIPDEATLASKIDWFENEYDDLLNYDDIIKVRDDGSPYMIKSQLVQESINHDLCCIRHKFSLIMQLIHTDIQNSTGLPKKMMKVGFYMPF